MHDYNIHEVDMRIIVGGVRAYPPVMDWGMVFDVPVSEVDAFGGPVNIELEL